MSVAEAAGGATVSVFILARVGVMGMVLASTEEWTEDGRCGDSAASLLSRLDDRSEVAEEAAEDEPPEEFFDLCRPDEWCWEAVALGMVAAVQVSVTANSSLLTLVTPPEVVMTPPDSAWLGGGAGGGPPDVEGTDAIALEDGGAAAAVAAVAAAAAAFEAFLSEYDWMEMSGAAGAAGGAVFLSGRSKLSSLQLRSDLFMSFRFLRRLEVTACRRMKKTLVKQKKIQFDTNYCNCLLQ